MSKALRRTAALQSQGIDPCGPHPNTRCLRTRRRPPDADSRVRGRGEILRLRCTEALRRIRARTPGGTRTDRSRVRSPLSLADLQTAPLRAAAVQALQGRVHLIVLLHVGDLI